MYKSLNDYISFLESKDQLIRIKDFCDPIYQIAEITDRESKKPNGGKALLFENTGTKYPVLTNMMGSQERILYTLGVDNFDQISQRINDLLEQVTSERKGIMDKLKALPILANMAKWLPKEHKGIPACQEVIQYKPELSKLPILKCWPLDGGKFITLPLVHTTDSITGIRNVGMYRMQVFTESTTGMHWHRHKTGARHFDEFKGDRMPVAVCLGGDPIYTYAATAPLPDGIDEYLLAGFLRGEGVSMAKCLTQDIKVPADCDFVIEGYVSKNEAKVIEGPFGDHTGFYSLADYYPTFHITCISHRKDAIYPATVVGVPPQEDKYMALATEKIFLSPIKLSLAPEIEDLYLPEEGVGHNFAVVKINKRYPGQAVKIAHSLWGAGQMMFNKMMLIVDNKAVNETINHIKKNNIQIQGDNKGNNIGLDTYTIRNHQFLAELVKLHYVPKRDTIFSRGPLDILDHSAPVCGFGGKLCIDATYKLPEEGETQSITPSANEFISFIHKNQDIKERALISVILDNNCSLTDTYRNLWLMGGNTDPIRDSKFVNGKLVLDATSKKTGENGFLREWPQIVRSSDETIKEVDNLISKIFSV